MDTKRKRSLSDSDITETNLLIDNIYNLPNKIHNINSNEIKIYETVKKNILEKHISLKKIIRLDNILDSERLELVEKFILMENSNNDLFIYFKLRDELLDLIQFYSITDI